jgi:gluconate 2-dehydrogenase gamma chain
MAHQRERTEGSAQPAKRFGRRTTLKLLAFGVSGTVARAAAASDPIAQSQPPAAPVGAGRRGRAWRLRPLAAPAALRTFAPDEFDTLACVVDRIIPDTDTPGARTAGVHWFLDDVCREDARLRETLRGGLQRLDQRARTLSGTAFSQMSEREQIALLEAFAGAGSVPDVTPPERAWFAAIRAQTVDAYYKSEMGQVGELEWVGHEFNDSFPGACTHGESEEHPRPRWPRARA